MQVKVDLDPEDLKKTYPGLQIRKGEGRDLSDLAGIQDDLETCGCAFVRSAFDPRLISRARGVIVSYLLKSGIIASENGDCPVGKGALLTGFREVTHSREMLRLVEGPEIRSLLSRIIGSPAETYDTKWLRVMAPGHSTEAHSDFYRFQSMRRAKMYICWIPLGACELSHGPLIICSGSHVLDYESGIVEFTEIPSQFCEMVEASVWLSFDFQPGDCCVFDVKSVHASLKNKEEMVRISVDTRWFSRS